MADSTEIKSDITSSETVADTAPAATAVADSSPSAATANVASSSNDSLAGVSPAQSVAVESEAPSAAAGITPSAAPESIEFDTPKIDTPKLDASKIDAPKIDAPKIEASKIEGSKIDSSKIDASKPSTTGDTLSNVRPGSEFSKPRPGFARYRPSFDKLIPSRQSARLAASLGLACGLGLLIGTIATFGAGHLLVATKSAPTVKSAATDETRALQQTVTRMQAQLASLKSSIDHSSKVASSQTARLSERYERDARTQTELQTRLNKIGETVDRLERRVAIALAPPDVTGSVNAQRTSSTTTQSTRTPTPVPAPQRVAAAPATTAAASAAEARKPATPQIVDGWVLRDVFRGRALVASRNGIFEAAPGLNLPGLGQVESVRRQDGQWVVVTERGLIVAARGARTHYRLDDD
jgi:hypothetical protein